MENITTKQLEGRTDCMWYKVFGHCEISLGEMYPSGYVRGNNPKPILCSQFQSDCKSYHKLKFKGSLN